VHLLAQRCESTYARFLTIVGCSDRDFPRPRSRLGHGASWMGIGPYLGQQEKFVVLVTATAEDFGRYTQAFLGERFRWPRRFDLGWNRGLFFGTSIDFEGNLRDDTALHCHVVYNLAQNFCDAYRHFRHEIPVWFECGFAQRLLREIDPQYVNVVRPPGGRPDGRSPGDIRDWTEAAAGLARHGGATPMRTMALWADYAHFRYHDYIAAWSRVEFIARDGERKLGELLHALKEPLTDGKTPPTWEMVLDQQARALHEVAGFADYDEFDRAWRAWAATQRE